jgi:flagellar biosynthesis/type III secretory pathway chaperone
MEPVIQELIKLMEEQKKIYTELLNLSRNKRKYLIKGDIESIDAVTKQEELLIYNAGKLENMRIDCFRRAAEKYGCDKDSTLKDILSDLPDEEAAALGKLYQEFSLMLNELENLNTENTGLIQQSLRFVNFTVDVLSQQTTPVYNAEKELKVERLNKLLDKKVL